MAELIIGLASSVARKFLSNVLDEIIGVSARATLQESITLPGARTLGQVASWIKDEEENEIPEVALNLSLIAETFLQLFASGIGTLALVWATVVLLGGFSTMLIRMDFWFITAIVFVETARIVGYNSGLEAKFFVDVPAAFSKSNNILGRIGSVPALIALAPIYAATACITLSIIRLVGIARHSYGGPNINDTSNGNLKPALILFYALVLTQGTLFINWFIVARNRSTQVVKLIEYFKDVDVIELKEGTKLMDRYVTTTLDTCIEKGVVTTMNRTLVTFVAELLRSEHSVDHISAVSVLYVVMKRKERTTGVVDEICASQKFAGRLFQLLRLKNPLDRHVKACTAEILAKLAGSLLLADIPEAAPSISSLLDGRLMETSAKAEFPGESHIIIDTDGGSKGKSLFLHGLLILGELCGEPENCSEICETTDLVSKIIAPVTHGLPKFIGNDSKTIQIVKASLVVVAKLTSGAGETSTKIRNKISDDNKIAENLLWILQKSDGMKSNGEMEILALEILTRLNLHDKMEELIAVLVDLLISKVKDSPLRIEAVRAMNALAADQATFQLIIGKQLMIQQLVNTIMRNDEDSEYRAVTAELLVQICANTETDEDKERLHPLSDSLFTVLKAFFDEPTNYAKHLKELQDINAEIANYSKRRKELQDILVEPTIQSFVKVLRAIIVRSIDRQVTKKVYPKRLKELHAKRDAIAICTECSRRFVSSLLALALEICDKLAITTEAFARVIALLEMDDRTFVQKLIEVVCQVLQELNNNTDFTCLKITKTMTKLATWMIRTNRSYIRYFQQEKIIENLRRAMKEMRDLERDLVLTGLTADETKAYEPFESLVENLKKLVSRQQH